MNFADIHFNSNATYYKISREVTFGMRGLVLTNQYFGTSLPYTNSIPKFLKTLTPIIIHEKINVLFFLGNLIDSTNESYENSSNLLKKILDAFEQLPIQIFIIGGNTDRDVFRKFKYDKNDSNIHIVQDYLMLLENCNPPENTPRRIFLGHDVGNNYLINNDECERFLLATKQALHSTIEPQDYLILGYGGTFIHNTDQRLINLRDFSLDTHHTNYCIITNDNGFTITTVGK